VTARHCAKLFVCCRILIVLVVAVCAFGQDQPVPPVEQVGAGTEELPHELFVTVGKSVIVSSVPPIERIAVGYGDVAEAMAVGPREVLVHGKAPGSTSLIVWQEGGGKLFFNVTVRPNPTALNFKLEGVRRELRQELPGQKITVSVENDTVFLRGTVKDLTSAERAVAIASTLGKVVNLLYVNVPETESQILLKVRFASVDRSAGTELGLNLISTGAANTIGTVSTQQFNPPRVSRDGEITLTDALNIFMLRPDIDLAATIKALQRKSLLEVLAEPNVLAINGRQASFLAGGEYPYPILQGGGAGLGTVTIQFREFGVRINFLPNLTPRGTIRLEVAPEVSALDFASGLVFQGFTIPALTVRRVHTEVELAPGQSFAIGGLLDRRLTETIQKIPVLADVPLLGKLFQSKSLRNENTELLVIVTPEVVRPIPAGQPLPQVEYPKPLPSADATPPQTPGLSITGTQAEAPPQVAIPVEDLIRSLQQAESTLQGGEAARGLRDSSWRPQTQLPPLEAPGAGAAVKPVSPGAAVKPAQNP